MGFETRELSGALFKNQKRSHESQPNARGECKIDGVIYLISALTKETKSGDKWQSLSFSRKDEQ